MDFLWNVLSGPFWFNFVLLFCAIVAFMAYGIRSLTAPSAWVMLGLFYVWVAASNSWHFIPYPDSTLPEAELVEAWRMWTVYLYETLILAYIITGAITAVALGWMAWGAYTKTVRITMLTVFYGSVVAVAQIGNAMQRYVCKTNDPAMGTEYLYWAAGKRTEACARLSVSLGLPETFGPLLFPALTVLILPVIMWRTKRTSALRQR